MWRCRVYDCLLIGLLPYLKKIIFWPSNKCVSFLKYPCPLKTKITYQYMWINNTLIPMFLFFIHKQPYIKFITCWTSYLQFICLFVFLQMLYPHKLWFDTLFPVNGVLPPTVTHRSLVFNLHFHILPWLGEVQQSRLIIFNIHELCRKINHIMYLYFDLNLLSDSQYGIHLNIPF